MDPENAQPTDFVCDFCRNTWAEDRPMVEGHHGSLICGPCLRVAFSELIQSAPGAPPAPGARCTMCLRDKDEPHWQSPAFPESFICRWCIEKSASMLERDPDSGWKRPA